MLTSEMMDLLKLRTKVADQSKLLLELRSGYRWAARRIFNAEGGPDLLVTLGEELTALAATTRDYNVGSLTAGVLLGIKQLWVKLPSDSKFTLMEPTDAGNVCFTNADSATTAAPVTAIGHPVFYTVVNVSKVRFAPALPSGAVVRIDYFRTGEPPDPTTNPTQTNGTDLPDVFHDAICSKAIAQTFGFLDDSREGAWETRARDELNDAIYLATKRTQSPPQTTPFRAGRRRVT